METDKNDGQAAINIDATAATGAGVEDTLAAATMRQKLALFQQQAMNMQRVVPSGTVNYYTQYDKVIGFHAAAMMKGMQHIGKVTENTPVMVLMQRDTDINDSYHGVGELMDTLIEAGGVSSLEQKAALLERIVGLVSSVLALAANVGLPFDIAYDLAHENEMRKVGPPTGPTYVTDEVTGAETLVVPEGWTPASKAIWEVCYRTYKLEMESIPANATDLAQPQEAANLGSGLVDAAGNDLPASTGTNPPATLQ